MFASARRGLAFRLENGQQIVVEGSVSVYERDGRYQLYANRITLQEAGLLYERFEALKAELSEMGMFAPEYKQPIPPYICPPRHRDSPHRGGGPGYHHGLPNAEIHIFS